MTAPLRILLSQTHNPWFNLATEEWLFREMDPSVQTLFLWRNQPTVVIGRNQNPWSECNLSKMDEDGVLLARRTSGGGAVFHDLGNTCFTFLSPRDRYDRSANIGIIVSALRALGIEAQASGRNDIIIAAEDGPRKVSGSAYRETRDRAFHHGTLLLHTDLTRLANYLTPHPKKLESKGRASVRARVMNLGELNSRLASAESHEIIIEAVTKAFRDLHGAGNGSGNGSGSDCTPQVLNHSTLETIPSLKASYEQFASWDWRYGHAPQFQMELTEYLSWGFFQIFIDVDKAHISRVDVFSDALYPEVIDELKASLAGKPFDKRGISEAIAATQGMQPSLSDELRELEAWLKTQVEI